MADSSNPVDTQAHGNQVDTLNVEDYGIYSYDCLKCGTEFFEGPEVKEKYCRECLERLYRRYKDVVTGKTFRYMSNYCRRGHEFTPENSYIAPNGRRRCRACNHMYYENKKADTTGTDLRAADSDTKIGQE